MGLITIAFRTLLIALKKRTISFEIMGGKGYIVEICNHAVTNFFSNAIILLKKIRKIDGGHK